MGERGPRAVLPTGDRVHLDGVTRTVTAIAGTVVRLTDGRGRTIEVGLVEVFTRGVVEGSGSRPANRLGGGCWPGCPSRWRRGPAGGKATSSR